MYALKSKTKNKFQPQIHGHKIALYIRVSTEEQAENPEGSIRNQEERLRATIKLRNMDGPFGQVEGVYIDRGKSGKDTNRPELQRLLQDIQRRQISLVMVSDLSRLSRSIRDFCSMWDLMKSCACSFQSLRENVDTTTAAGEMVLFTLANLAQFERAQTAERVAANMQARASRGLYNGGRVALGYRVCEGKPGYLEIVPSEADLVKAAFQAVIAQGALSGAAKWLNANGHTVPRRHGGGGGRVRIGHFTVHNLSLIIRNPVYLGKRAVLIRGDIQHVKAVWEPLVDETVFDRANEILTQNLQTYKPESFKKYPYVLSGLTFCGTCGRSLCGKSATGRVEKIPYYEHGWLTKRDGCLVKKAHDCNPFRLGARKLEPAVLEKFEEMLSSSTTASEILRIAEERQRNDGRLQALRRARARVGELDGQIEVLAERLASLPKTISPDTIYKQMERLQLVKSEAEASLETLKVRSEGQVVAAIESYEQLLSLARQVKENALPEESQRAVAKALRALIQKIEVMPEGFRLHVLVGDQDIARGLSHLSPLVNSQQSRVRELLTNGWSDRD